MELKGKRIIVLAEDNYQELELWYPLLRMKEAGAEVLVAGSGRTETHKSKNGYPVKIDVKAEDVNPADIDAVIVPGGYAPDIMRVVPGMLSLVKGAAEQGKVVAFICHAAWVLISAGVVKGKTMTSVQSIKDDVINAGAKWVDESVVVDGNMISSRRPPDLPDFCRAIIEKLK